MKTFIIRMICCFLFITCIHTVVIAQPEENGDDPPPSDVPLDGGTSILLAAGVAYGIRKVRNKKALSK